MANTIAEAVASGWKAGVDIGEYGKQEEAQTSLISSQAEVAREKISAYKAEQALQLQRRAGLSQILKEHTELSPAKAEDMITATDLWIKANPDNVEAIEKANESKQEIIKQRDEAIKTDLTQREAKRAVLYDELTTAMLSEEGTVGLLTSQDPTLQKMGHVLNSKVPLAHPKYRDPSTGKPRFYNQLSF